MLLIGCSIEPPLFLRKATTTGVVLNTQVDVNVMWQVDWTTEWQYNWAATAPGPIGYSIPSSMRVHVYPHGPEGVPISHTVYNFKGISSYFDVFTGTYDFLFHNVGSEYILFSSEGDLDHVCAYTRTISSAGLKASSPVYSSAQKAAAENTKGDPEPGDKVEPVVLEPDDLFSLYVPSFYISDNLDDYTYENGRYIIKIEQLLSPSTFIYLFQINLLNNRDRVIASGGAALTGMSRGVDMMTRETYSEKVSVPMNMFIDRSTDMMGSKVYSFGIPGCNPYDAASVAAAPSGIHNLVINVTYGNNTSKNIRIDVTDQIRALPLGGVITLDLDVDDFPPEGGGGGGGFGALINDWTDEIGTTVIKP